MTIAPLADFQGQERGRRDNTSVNPPLGLQKSQTAQDQGDPFPDPG